MSSPHLEHELQFQSICTKHQFYVRYFYGHWTCIPSQHLNFVTLVLNVIVFVLIFKRTNSIELRKGVRGHAQ